MTWTNDSLRQLVAGHPDWTVKAEGECFSVSNDEGIDAFVYVGEQQIVVETILFPVASVANEAELNKLILRTHQLLPLTSVGITTIDGANYYVAFGALSVSSRDEVVIEEIETLLANVSDFMDLYADYLQPEKVA
jgi:uncharacterized protein YjfI (DUF2170 family)